METRKRKYFFEIALQVMTKDSILLRPNQLSSLAMMSSDAKKVIERASVYLICAKPRIRINPLRVSRSNNDLHFVTETTVADGLTGEKRSIQGFFEKMPYVVGFRAHQSSAALVEFVDEHGNELGNWPVEVFLFLSGPGSAKHLTYEVMYVGQSRFSQKPGGILNCLNNHPTLQRVLADIVSDSPHLEVVVMSFEIEEPEYGISGNPFEARSTSNDQDISHAATA